MKAFVNIRATGRFTDRVQIAGAQFRFQLVERFEVCRAFSRPFGQARALSSRIARSGIDMNNARFQIRLSDDGRSYARFGYISSLPLYTMSFSLNLYFTVTSPSLAENSTSLSSSVKGFVRGKWKTMSFEDWASAI